MPAIATVDACALAALGNLTLKGLVLFYVASPRGAKMSAAIVNII
jgi:hypothetical protein